MTLAILVAVAVTVAVVVDTLAPLGARSGLGIRRGPARTAVSVEETPGNRVPEPRRATESAGRGLAVTPSRGYRTWNENPARIGRRHRAAAKASLS